MLFHQYQEEFRFTACQRALFQALWVFRVPYDFTFDNAEVELDAYVPIVLDYVKVRWGVVFRIHL